MTIPANFMGAEGLLHAAASAATGLTDFGDAREYLPGLTTFLNALENDGPVFHEKGREYAWNMALGVLIARLLSEQGFKDNAPAMSIPIKRPLIIIGVPRTGTTALHKLLSMDPQFQGMERWLTAFPMPRPARDTWEQNPWYQACVNGLEQFFADAPEMRAAHNMRADDVDECIEVLKQSFISNNFGSSLRVPSYDRWWLQQSEASAYQRLYKVLQLIGAKDVGKTWLLKNPGHVAEVENLLNTFPDACIIQTHRAPSKAIPSLCSVLVQARGVGEKDINPHEIGQRERSYWSAAVERAAIARERAPKQFLDILQSDIQRNPMAVVERIYGHFGLTLSDEARAKMIARSKEAPESSHGAHNYTSADFGLNDADLNQLFANYNQQHGLT